VDAITALLTKANLPVSMDTQDLMKANVALQAQLDQATSAVADLVKAMSAQKKEAEDVARVRPCQVSGWLAMLLPSSSLHAHYDLNTCLCSHRFATQTLLTLPWYHVGT
jgi:hypothetical protein